MRILLDTNILARLAQPKHALHLATKTATEALIQDEHELRILPQIIYEFWAIATRSVKDNGLGLTIEQVTAEVDEFKTLFPPLRDERGIFERWQDLVATHRVSGKTTHDARIVAAMLKHGIHHILTFNGTHFIRYPNIEVLDPIEIAKSSK